MPSRSSRLSLKALLPPILRLLASSSSSVSCHAFSILMEMYRQFGETLRNDLLMHNIPQQRLRQIFERFDRIQNRAISGKRVDKKPNTPVEEVGLPAAPNNENGKDCIRDKSYRVCSRQLTAAIPQTKNTSLKAYKKRTLSAFSPGTKLKSSPSMEGEENEDPSSPGAIDDDSFKSAFEATPVLSNFIPKDLRPQMESIKLTLADPNNDWEKRFDALKRIRSLILSKAYLSPDFKLLFKQLEIPLQTTLKDLRSQIVREACITIAFIAQHLETSLFDHMAENLIPCLQLLIQNSAKVMSHSAILTIKYILSYTHSSRLVPPILLGMSSKSKEIRRNTCKFIYRILLDWPVEVWSKYANSIQESIKSGIEDPDVNARMYSRCSFFIYQKLYPAQAEQLFNALDPSKKKLLREDLNFSASKQSSGESSRQFKSSTLSSLPSQQNSLDSSLNGAWNGNSSKPPSKFRMIRNSRMQRNGSYKISNSQPASRTTSPSVRLNGARSIRPLGNSMHRPANGRYTPGISLESSRLNNSNRTPNLPSNRTIDCTQGSDDEIFSQSSGQSSHPSVPASRVAESFTESLQLLTSSQWDEKHEGLSRIRAYMYNRTFSKTEIKKLAELFCKLFSELHGKTLVLFLDVLAEFIERYHQELNEYMEHILLGLLSKTSMHDNSSATGQKVIVCLDTIKRNFDPRRQLTSIMNVLVDESMILKLKLSVLKLLLEMLNSAECPASLAECGDLAVIVAIIIRMTTDKKSGELRRIAQKVLGALYNANSSEFNEALSALSKDYKITAANVLNSRSRGGFSTVYMSLELGTSTLRKPLKRAQTPADTENSLKSSRYGLRSISPKTSTRSATACSNSSRNGNGLQRYDSEELLNDFASISISEKSTDQQQLEFLSPLIIQIAQQTNSVESRFKAMQCLSNVLSDILPTVWNEHFDTILLLMIRTLSEPHLTLQINALRILDYLLRNHSDRFNKYHELTIFKLLECQGNAVGSTEFIQPVIEETIRACATSLPVNSLLQALKPIVNSADKWPMQLAALRMVEQVVERSTEEQCKEYAADVCSALMNAWESEHSSVRKAVVFCFVAVHSRAGYDTLQPILNSLPSNKLKLLNVYIKRRQEKLTDVSSKEGV